MKISQGIVLGVLMLGSVETVLSQQSAVINSSPSVRPAVGFPPTPTPAPIAAPMTAAELEAHLVPTAFLSRTSSVLGLVYNGFRRSQVDACGCVTHQLGGLAKEATLVKDLDKLGIPLVKVDAGGFVRDMPDKNLLTQSTYLVKGLGGLGYDVINVGFPDLDLGVDALKQTAKEANVTLLSANIQDGAGELKFAPYVVKEVTRTDGSKLKVGIIGITRPRVELPPDMATSGSAVAAVAASGSPETIVITDPGAAVVKYVDEVTAKSDMVVVLDYDRRTNADRILKAIKGKGVDILIFGENAQQQGNVQTSDGVHVVSGGYEGRQIGTLYVELKGNDIVANWNKLIEILQTIPSDPETEKLVEKTHEAVKPAASETPASNPTKLDLN